MIHNTTQSKPIQSSINNIFDMGKLTNHSDIDEKCPSNKNQRSRGIKVKRDPIKVTYISSPMMVKASNASEFRAIVQELTGKNSDVISYDHDVFSTPTFSDEEESLSMNHHHHHQEAVDQALLHNITAHRDQQLMDDAFSNNTFMSLLDNHHDLVDERFLWSELVSVGCNSFGF